MMTCLCQQLALLPHRDLRAIATRLGVRRRGEDNKAEWIDAIDRSWHDPALRARLLDRLSPGARTALHRLRQAGSLPTPIFLAEYGGIRRAGPSPPPWREPQSASEELYYSGLLYPTPRRPIERSERVSAPADLPPFEPVRPNLPQAIPGDPLPLLHDVSQVLVYLCQHPGLALHHQRWLPPVHTAALNRRLLRPEAPMPRRHKRARWLRFVFFLATAAELQVAGRVTPMGWAWLSLPSLKQLAQLWHAWKAAPPALREAYVQPDAGWPDPWPQPLLEQLAHQTTPFAAAQLTNLLLGQEVRSPAHFPSHVLNLNSVDTMIEGLLAMTLSGLAVVSELPGPAPKSDVSQAPPAEPTGATDRRGPRWYVLTTTGGWLLDAIETAPPIASWTTTGQLEHSPPDTWQLLIPTTISPHLQARLAPYTEYSGLQAPADLTCHVHLLNEASVARAAAAGHGLPALLDCLQALDIELDPGHSPAETEALSLPQIHRWHDQGRTTHLLNVFLLRTATATQMAHIQQLPDIQRHLGETLSPTTCLVTGPLERLVEGLRRSGVYPNTTQLLPDETGNESDSTSYDLQLADLPPEGALWLAGQLYALLGQYLGLPLPPPFTTLGQELGRFSPAQQALLQSQWQQLRQQVLELLDGQAFTPPPQPSDPDRWRRTIERVIADERSLEMTYFTAGRNLLTRRVVDPYWIEERHGVAYLRAYCHLSDRVRTFRLDRIQDLSDRPLKRHRSA